MIVYSFRPVGTYIWSKQPKITVFKNIHRLHLTEFKKLEIHGFNLSQAMS